MGQSIVSVGIKYRPEIDGLRTIAVLSVVFYHAEILVGGKNIIPGGYLGVDVFFCNLWILDFLHYIERYP